MITIGVELVPMRTPNYILCKGLSKPRQDGFIEEQKYHIKDLDAGTLGALCDQFRDDIFKKSGKKDPRA